MSTVQLPTDFGLPVFRAVYELDSVPYGFTFRINRRDNAWRAAIDRDGTTILHDMKIVQSEDLLIGHKHDLQLPQGVLRVVDLDGTDAEPTEDNFGDSVILVYDEVA